MCRSRVVKVHVLAIFLICAQSGGYCLQSGSGPRYTLRLSLRKCLLLRDPICK